jgi:Protein of unknown function DUF262.
MTEYKPYNMTILDFISAWNRGEVYIDKDIQRNAVWSTKYKIGFIDTIIKGYPIPLIFIEQKKDILDDGSKKQIFSIIDGQQRMASIRHFI